MSITLTGRNGAEVNIFPYTAGEHLLSGQPIYINADKKVYKAKGDSLTTLPCTGITVSTANANDTVLVAESGEVNDVVADEVFTANDLIYVSPLNAGHLTNIPPSSIGNFAQIIGVAKNTTSITVQIDHTIIEVQT